MKRNCELRTAALATLFMAVLCIPGHSAPTPEQRAERTNLLIQAIDNNNVEQAKACIKLGADVNGTVITDEQGYTRPMLMYAIVKENKAIAEMLIQAGADVNAKTDDGVTAIMSAASFGLKDIAEQLIKAGADVNAKADNGWSALMLAQGNETKDIAELLIKAGANVNTTDDNGWTALILATGNGAKDIVELLIKAGADVNATELDIAAAIDEKLPGFNALMYAARLGNKDNEAMVKLFIDLGADVNATDSEGISVLTYAALYGRNDIVELLKAAGARE